MSKGQEILNNEEVEFLLGSSGSAAKKETVQAQSAQQAVTMRGDLDQMPLTDVFQTLGMNKMEGVLRLANPVEQRVVYFHNGNLRILLPARQLLRRLGQQLIQAGLVDGEGLRSALLEQRKTQAPLDEVLVQSGRVDQAQIEQILAVQVSEELFGLFTWTHGTFEFWKGPPQDPGLAEKLEKCHEFEINSLLLEVARRSDEWEGILATLGNLDEVPVRCVDAAPEDLDESLRAVFDAIDGKHSYRELADLTVLSLFDAARAARVLVEQGLVARATDQQLLDLAKQHLEQGHPKIALVLARTIADRANAPGEERPVAFVRELAAVLRGADEPKAAAGVLLESAQLQSDAQLAMQLAQEARTICPRELAVLSFLRTTMMAHLRPDAPELRQITLDLLDGLLADGDVDRAFTVVEETRQIGHYAPPIMVRESRAFAKRGDRDSAVRVMLEAANGFAGLGDRRQQLELLELAYRLDRSRKDVHKQIQQLRSTPKKRAIRLASSIAAGILVLAGGATWIGSMLEDRRIAGAEAQVEAALHEGRIADAVRVYDEVAEAAADHPRLETLRQRVRTAETEHLAATRERVRHEAADRLQQAAQFVAQGDLPAAFELYASMSNDEELKVEAESAANTRVDGLVRALTDAAIKLPDLLPPPPSDLMDAQRISETVATLRRIAPPDLQKAAAAIQRLEQTGAFPAALPEQKRKQLGEAATRARAVLERSGQLLAAYETASNRSDEQRRLDPLFKKALDAERRLDLESALASYQQLAASGANTPQLAQHFQTKTRQLQAVLAALSRLRAATAAGDFKTASKEHVAMQRQFPELQLQKLVKLPVHVRTSMPGATVRWNGEEIGKTPLLATYAPGAEIEVDVRLERFQPVRMDLPSNHGGALDLVLQLQQDGGFEASAVVDQPLAWTPERSFAVDRSGAVLAIDHEKGSQVWRRELGDGIGQLQAPRTGRGIVVVTSLDAPTTALAQEDGAIRWQRDDLRSEWPPAVLDGRVAVATSSDEVLLLDPANGSELGRARFPSPVAGELVNDLTVFAAPLRDGRVALYDAKTMDVRWTTSSPLHGASLAFTDAGIVAQDEAGVVTMLDLQTGKPIWTRDLAGTPTGRPAFAQGRVVAVFDDRIAVLAAADGAAIATIDKGATPWTGSAHAIGDYVAVATRDESVQVFAVGETAPRLCFAGGRDAMLAGDRRQSVAMASGRRIAVFQKLP